ncbi:hypothetical protein D0T60_03745 [Bacteroides sp. 224]|nr:hypothetical protein [Bacteroides sp. 224]
MKKRIYLLCLSLAIVLVAVAQEKAIKVACIGNSITYGSGIKDRANDSYPAVLGKLLGDKYEVRNYGISGRTLLNNGDRPYMKEDKFQEVQKYLPDIVVIKLGTNDSKPQNWKYKEEFSNDMQTMINILKNLSSKPQIYLCYPAKAYGVAFGINDSIIENSVIPYIKKVAKKNKLRTIDLQSATDGMPENFPDKIHPNEKGAAVIAETVYNAIKKKK